MLYVDGIALALILRSADVTPSEFRPVAVVAAAPAAVAAYDRLASLNPLNGGTCGACPLLSGTILPPGRVATSARLNQP